MIVDVYHGSHKKSALQPEFLRNARDADLHAGMRLPILSSEPVSIAPVEISITSIAQDRKSTRLNSSHLVISYAVFCLKKKIKHLNSSHLAISDAVFGLQNKTARPGRRGLDRPRQLAARSALPNSPTYRRATRLAPAQP